MKQKIAIIGGGPAGLMAAHHLVGKGFDLHLFESMPSLGRKFLMAGKSGMNLTHNEPLEHFLSRYHDDNNEITKAVNGFTPADIRNWATALGVETFVGSSGRIFPTDFKAAPLLRSWLRHLKAHGLTTHVRHRWTGWDGESLSFDTQNGPHTDSFDAVLFAMGAISWPKLGSDGAWLAPFATKDIQITPFKPSNCGFLRDWSPHFLEKFAGRPIKSVSLRVGENQTKGDFVLTQSGVEGSAIYTHSRALRLELEARNTATLYIDLSPDRSAEQLHQALTRPKGSKSLSTHLKRATNLPPVKIALLREVLDKDSFTDLTKLARSIKDLPLPLNGMRPIDEAISCAGGVDFDGLDEGLMLKDHPGLFLAGEMLNWDAPTGGYLLTACFATGKRATLGMESWLRRKG
ncbi:TIGR03862 family flavoprotein [Terasakiella pusilla]|uniref:TIGR03862 family flavoprotein n=1 Tax=Terasakiella pusilla TaxID=64973 RepID=UPI003AA80E21